VSLSGVPSRQGRLLHRLSLVLVRELPRRKQLSRNSVSPTRPPSQPSPFCPYVVGIASGIGADSASASSCRTGVIQYVVSHVPPLLRSFPILIVKHHEQQDVKESVGSHAPRVILFGTEVPIVPADPLVAPEVGVVYVTSPTGVLDLVDYSSSNYDPSKDSLPPAPELPLVSPFLCSDDSEADSESEPAEQRPERHESLVVHDVMVSRWMDRVTSRPSSPSGSLSYDTFALSSEFPVAPVVAPLGIHRRPAILIQPGEAIPFGRPYRTYPNGSHKLLNVRKRIGPFPARRLAWRRISHHSSDRYSSPGFTSDS
ncbi:hypothetical protein Tco_1530016, partial [Tanacetum coccineum]